MSASVLKSTSLVFEPTPLSEKTLTDPLEVDSSHYFGVYSLEANLCSETTEPLEFVFTIDCSGSMSDMCSDGRSKMQHTIHTLKNMIVFLKEHSSLDVHLTIRSFDIYIYPVVDRVCIRDVPLETLLASVGKIYPRGSTNIEKALTDVSAFISSLHENYPSHIVHHIFMTDGEVTSGSKLLDTLKSLVSSGAHNAFIGFGIEHDAILLNSLSTVGKSSYYFIDKLENAGLVYGEILHSILYKNMTDCTLNIEQGAVYDYRKNAWVQSLYVGDVVSEAKKTYHIVSATPDQCRVCMTGTRQGGSPFAMDARCDASREPATSHLYRQQTLQVMFKVNEYCTRKRTYEMQWSTVPYGSPIHPSENRHTVEPSRSTIVALLTDLMRELKQHMTDQNLTTDPFLQNLCDDLYICYRTFDTQYGNMFCTARQTSQGTQRQYAVTHFDFANDHDETSRTVFLFNGPANVARQSNAPSVVDPIISLFDHEISESSAYMTPQATQVMRYVSST